MRRNMDLIRLIALGRSTFEYPPEVVDKHVALMHEGGLLGNGGLTFKGQDFADLANDIGWAWAKERVEKVGGSSSFDVWMLLLRNYHERELHEI